MVKGKASPWSLAADPANDGSAGTVEALLDAGGNEKGFVFVESVTGYPRKTWVARPQQVPYPEPYVTPRGPYLNGHKVSTVLTSTTLGAFKTALTGGITYDLVLVTIEAF